MTSKLLCTLLIVLLTTVNVAAQNKPLQKDIALTEDDKASSEFKISTNYLSNNVYQGRQSDELLSLITTGVEYYHKSGFFINGSFTYIPNVGYQQIDRKELKVGYNYSGDKLNIATYLARYFYNDSSSEINAAVGSSAGIGASYDFNYLTIGGAADFNFLTKTDIVLNANLGHSFYLANDKLLILPVINMNAGTENFYQSYFTPQKSGGTTAATRAATKAAKHRRNPTSNTTTTTPANNTSAASKITILNSNEFKIMDYEIGLPIEYKLNKFMLSFTPTYILPVHPASISYNNVTTTEVLKNTFVVELGVSFTF